MITEIESPRRLDHLSRIPAMKLPNDYPNKDTSVLNPKEFLQGEVVNSWDKSRVAQRVTWKIKGMVAKIVQSP